MSKQAKPKPKRRWLRVVAWTFAFFLVAIGAGMLALDHGWFDGWIRDAIVHRIEQMTGGRVELAGFRFDAFTLHARLDGLTIHEREAAGTAPFFHADSIDLQVQIVSLWEKKITLRELQIKRPAVHIAFNKDGTSNLPVLPPAKPGAKPFRLRIFDLAIGHLELDDGTILYNDARIPLVAEGKDLDFTLDWGNSAGGAGLYLGKFRSQKFSIADKKFLPVNADLSLKFTFSPDEFLVDQMRLKVLDSTLDAEADVKNLTHPSATFRYRGNLALPDLRAWMKKPAIPSGAVDFNGGGNWDGKDWVTEGHYSAREVALRFQWFHDSGITSRGDYHASHGQLVVPDFEAHAFGGEMTGRVNLTFKGLLFRVDSQGTGMSLEQVLAAVDNPSLPVNPLHWDGMFSVEATTTWSKGFQHVTSRGTTIWDTSKEPKVGSVPATAHIEYDYSEDRNDVIVRSSEIDTASSSVKFNGTLGAKDTALEVGVDIRDLLPWDDFINRIRGATAEPMVIGGSATWLGKLTGPLGGPEFSGHFHGQNAKYGDLYWDDIEGDMLYNPDAFDLQRVRATRGKSSAQLEMSMELAHWTFAPDAQWSFDAAVVATPTQGLQEMFGWKYAASGLLTGQFHMRGTRSDPSLTGLFDIANLDAWGWKADHARGQLVLNHDEIKVQNADIRLTPRTGGAGAAAGTLTGDFSLKLEDRSVDFNLTGAVIPIENIGRIQTARMPLSGSLNFQLKGSGPILTPKVAGTLRLVDLRAGNEDLGSFDAKLNSDGAKMRLDVSSALPPDRLRGWVELGLSGNFPLTGELDSKGLDIDPLIEAGLHLDALTGHSSMDAHVKIAGAAMQPDTITADANISKLAFDYEYVKLENSGPLEITYSRNEVRVQHASLKGDTSDFQIEGFAHLGGTDRSMQMAINGKVDMHLLGGFIPTLDVRGAAAINTTIAGTIDRPLITGRMQMQDASVNYGDFPAGLSKISGEFVFDTSRMVFDNVHAETGGGQMILSGSLTYGEGKSAARYDITTRATGVRVRYPEGMSWLANGTLRFAGNFQAAQLTGNVTIQRVLMSQGFDLASLVSSPASSSGGPSTSSPFLRNLQFEIQADSAPNARVEWNGAQFDANANMRIRGTWENPNLLGHISLQNGQITFAGNKYRVTRGDIDFVDPFRMDPVLSMQATTTISQYEVTLDLTGKASHLNLSYRSDPSLPTSDIISLLALGQPTQSTQYASSSGGNNSQMGATTLLSEAISSQLGGRVEKLFGITSFRVDPFLAGTGTEQNAATRVTVQQQVSKNISVIYSTNVTGSQEEVIQIEYQVRPDLSIVALRDINGTFSLDIVKKIRFK